MTITAESLFAAATACGVPAFDAAPHPLIPRKVLLASIVDVSDPSVRSRLLALHRDGAIRLARVDLVGAVPEDRRGLLAASAIRDHGSLFDVILVDAVEGVDGRVADDIDRATTGRQAVR